MTRALVFLSAALAAASLGVFAQDNSTSAASPTNSSSVQAGVQDIQRASQPSPSEPSPGVQNVSAQSQTPQPSQPGAATANRQKAIEDSRSSSGETTAGTKAQLPQTSTILPLLGLIGLGSLVAGLFARR